MSAPLKFANPVYLYRTHSLFFKESLGVENMAPRFFLVRYIESVPKNPMT